MNEKFRLNKFISDSGVCSRREADKFIEQGHVFVNGKRAQIGTFVSNHDNVLLNGNKVEGKIGNNFVFLAFNKPVNIVSTTEIGVKNSIIDYIGYHERIFPIGRLDKDSQGLIFLTNNGDIVNKILRSGNNHEKEYLVTVNKLITDEFIEKMKNGIPILGTTTKRCKISKVSTFSFNIILTQGMNRQIRRMCEYLNYEVTKLERIRIMNISLKNLPLGEWRQLSEIEINDIMSTLSNSKNEVVKTNEKSATISKSKPANSKKTEHKEFSHKKPIIDRNSISNPKSKSLRKSAPKGRNRN